MSYLFDHRQLAEEMALFCLNDDVGPGLPLWLPNGVLLKDKLESFIKDLERRAGYQRVSSPQIAKAKLYRISGHLDCFEQEMFPPMQIRDEAEPYYLRPMNCPHHHMIYASEPRSYRDLPLRLAEYGQVYRNEASGALRGLSRVRGLCQNDAHIYVDRVDAASELVRVLDLHEQAYRLLGLKGYRYRLSLRDPSQPNAFRGEAADWDQAERLLREALEARGCVFYEEKGEAAFYGPKIDIQMRLGNKEESISSIQLDVLSGARFGLEFRAADGSQAAPWIIHRAPLGSHERFIAMLLEYYDGQLPAWLAPVQVALIPVGESDIGFCRSFREKMIAHDIRAHVEIAQGSLAKRVQRAHRLRPACKIVIGERDRAGRRLRVQFRDHELDLDFGNAGEPRGQNSAGLAAVDEPEHWLERLRRALSNPVI